VTGCRIDGTNLEACLGALGGAIDRARKGGGPQLVVADLLRLCGHGEHDDASYVDPKLRNSPLGQDCLKLAETWMLQRQWTDPQKLAGWRTEAVNAVDAAVATVQQEPGPDPYQEEWCALASPHLREFYHRPQS
jgi:acetoin:2,6-dichlorophenolindophenol oxidoreductase subunit alpha